MGRTAIQQQVMQTEHLVVVGDSADMSRLHDESVHLVVTSPPYFDARDYADDRQIGHGGTLEEYRRGLASVLRECYRVLQAGRRFCLNISDLPVPGSCSTQQVL